MRGAAAARVSPHESPAAALERAVLRRSRPEQRAAGRGDQQSSERSLAVANAARAGGRGAPHLRARLGFARMTAFVAGALTAGYVVIALFFLRFRSESGDRLFTIFAAAFGLLAVQRFALFYYGTEVGIWLYTLRLFAFALILFAIIDKNAKSPQPR